MKNTILIGMSLLVFGGTGFAAHVPVPNYSDIASQYAHNQPIADISTAIKIVKEHYNSLKAQRAVYRPGALRVLGTGLGLVAGVGIVGSVGGAYRVYTILNSPENSKVGELLSTQPKEVQEKAREYGAQEYMKYIPFNKRGLSYSDALKFLYLSIEPSGEKVKITEAYLGDKYYIGNNPVGALVIVSGLVAPAALPISLVLAGLSKYLFNKATSYQDPELEALIAQDEKMLRDLRAMQQ